MKKRILALVFAVIFILSGCSAREGASGKISKILENMTLSEKIYQMMFVTPESLTGIGIAVQAGDATKEALIKMPVGGIVYFSQNLKTREQTTEMIENSQVCSEIPLFIGVDEEGGRVARLGSNPEMGVTVHPPMKEIGESGDEKQAYNVGKTLGKDLISLGFNVDFAPVCDVIVNENNTEIGDRSFGTDTEVVAFMVSNVVKGLEENGVSSALKHFPGHGSTFVDSHTGYSASDRSLEELRENELIPFKEGIKAGADFVMVSHMTLVNATEENLPSSVSKEIITDLLKNELGYRGIVITDSFSMGAIVREYSVPEAAVMSIEAGADMILMPYDIAAVHDEILRAVGSGRITEERIDESVRKILSLKEDKNLLK